MGQEVCLPTAEVFDWSRGAWSPIPAMSTARVGAAAAVIGKLVIVAGGYTSRASDPLSSVECYNPLTDKWRMLPPMPTRRYGLALASVGNRIFAIGGDDGNDVSAANEVQTHA